MWIGTRNALIRYDGFEIRQYTRENSALSGDEIAAIWMDSKGRMWVGSSDKGLNLYVPEMDSFVSFRHDPADERSLSSDEIRVVHEDARGRLWIGTKRGLNLYNESRGDFLRYWMSPDESESKDYNIIQAIASDSLGNVWVGTFGGGLRKLEADGLRFGQRIGQQSSSAQRIYTLALYSPEELLIGTKDDGLLVFNTRTQEFSPITFTDDDNSGHMFVRTLRLDGDRLWVGTDGVGIDGNGLYQLQRTIHGWQVSVPLPGYGQQWELNHAVYSLFVDAGSNLWVGSAWRGLKVLEHRDSEIELLYGDLVGDRSTPVWSIYRSGDMLWLGTDGRGLNGYNLRTGQVRAFNPGTNRYGRFDGEYALSIHGRQDGKLWIGTYLNGLILFDPEKGQIRKYKHDPENPASLSHNNVQDLVEVGPNQYWVATRGGGLNYFDEARGTFRAFLHDVHAPSSISNNNVVALEKAPNGKIWVATYGGGINLFDPEQETFRRFQHVDGDTASLSSDKVTCLLLDSKGYLWIGTAGSGLNRLDTRTLEIGQFNARKHFHGETIAGILEDDNHHLWVSTRTGIYQYYQEENRFFYHSDLKGEYHDGSAYKSLDGTLYFGGLDGVVHFDPDRLPVEKRLLAVKLTGFQLFNKPVHYGSGQPLDQAISYAKEIRLKYDENVITFEFAALQLPFSGDCRYAIKMENFDKAWRDNGTNRTATYTNLAPGSYTFHVKLMDDKEASSEMASVPVFIANPPWATWWAYVLYLMAILALLYAYHHYNVHWQQMKNQLKMELLTRQQAADLHEMKLRFFTNISHEIRTPVTLIIGAINRLLEAGITDKSQVSSIQTIRKNGNHLLNLVTELLDFRKLEVGDSRLHAAEGNLIKFSKEIFLSFSEQAVLKNIRYDFHAETDVVRVWYDRDEMEKVVYNLLSNAFKYTDAGGSITLTVSADDQFAFMAICDTGKGIAAEQLPYIFQRFYQSDGSHSFKNTDHGFGLGLSIAYDIVKLHGGEIVVESNPGAGTVFTLKLPLGSGHLRAECLVHDFRDSEQLSGYQSVALPEEHVSFHFSDQSEMTLLVAEDNPGIRQYLHDLLSPHFQILLAADGAEALELTLNRLPDLVLSDVMMPVMDGITFTGKIKSDPRTSHIPVIILTARTSLIYKKEGLDIGADDYITKPFSESLLKSRIRNLLHNRMLLREKYQKDLLIQPTELAMRSPDQEFLTSISHLIENHMSEEELSAEFICREMGMSQSNIYKKLKALTGMSIVEFVRDFRLKQAAQLMVRQKLSVSEACFKVGFNDRRYFSQMFKSKYGITPTQYVQQESE